MPDRVERAKRSLRKKGAVKKAGDKTRKPDARDAAQEQAAKGDPLWFPWRRRR